MSPRKRVLIGVLLNGAALLGQPVYADSGMLNGSLGQWLDATAAPQLAETLSRHPKFKGETVRFVPLRNGKAIAAGNALTQAVEQRLTQQLLRREGVRLAWREDTETCAAPQAVPYLLGIEIQANGTRDHQLNIAMMDVREGVWVSGVSLGWEGRLSSAERAALGRKVVSGRAGSTENPLPLRESSQISEIIRAGLQCSLPGGVDGPLYIETPAQTDLAAIGQSLSRALSIRPLAAITPDRQQAQWVMQLNARAVGTGGQQVLVTLRDTSGGEVAQQVAAVFVTGLDLSPSVDSTATITEPPAGTRMLASRPGLLTQLTVQSSAPNGICAASRTAANGCVEVGFELLRPAYLLVLFTEDQRLRSQACGRSLQLADPGERRYRMRFAATQRAATQPDAGLYVLAVEDRRLAQQIVHHLNRGPGACASVPDDVSLADWLRGLDELIQQHAIDIDWRATHLRHSTNGIVRL